MNTRAFTRYQVAKQQALSSPFPLPPSPFPAHGTLTALSTRLTT